MKIIRVAIVDNHWIVREGLKSVLESDPLFHIVGEASDGEGAIELLRKEKPDVALVDIKLPDMSGIEICQRITSEGLPTATVIFTAFLEWKLVQRCLDAGARGYILKDAKHLNLKEKLLSVARGETVLDPRVVTILTDHVRGRLLQENPILSARELEILRLMAQGLSNKEIGERLFLSRSSVKHYVGSILRKLDAKNRVEAILIATRSEIL